MAAELRKLIIVSSEAFGQEEEVGRRLLVSYFKLLTENAELPATVFFLNIGVMLTTQYDVILPQLQQLAQRGVRILSCSICLNYFGLTESLRVGEISGMMELVALAARYQTLHI